MKHQNRSKLAGLLLASLATYSSAWSLSSDRQKPLRVSADSVEINDSKGISIYDGRVVITQGSMRITARKVLVFHDKQRQIKRIRAFGKPATYKVRPDNEKYDLKASAHRMEFLPQKDLMIMTTKAKVDQGLREFRSHRIKYNLKTNYVDAGKSRGQNKGNRVNIVITPENKKAKKPAPKK